LSIEETVANSLVASSTPSHNYLACLSHKNQYFLTQDVLPPPNLIFLLPSNVSTFTSHQYVPEIASTCCIYILFVEGCILRCETKACYDG